MSTIDSTIHYAFTYVLSRSCSTHNTSVTWQLHARFYQQSRHPASACILPDNGHMPTGGILWTWKCWSIVRQCASLTETTHAYSVATMQCFCNFPHSDMSISSSVARSATRRSAESFVVSAAATTDGYSQQCSTGSAVARSRGVAMDSRAMQTSLRLPGTALMALMVICTSASWLTDTHETQQVQKDYRGSVPTKRSVIGHHV